MEPLKVLLADDEDEVLQIMVRRLKQEGFGVIAARDGEEAWQKIVAESPDIILLDVNMPHKDGFEVLKLVRQNPRPDKWQPVIIVSARQELPDIQQGFSLEADHYLTKPCGLDDIVKAVRLMAQLIPQRRGDHDR